MSKAVLISIKPKWCELIASGKKTVEVRKTKPKLETPFKCYIYCTKAKDFFSFGGGMVLCRGVGRMSSVSMIDGHIDEQPNNCHGCKWLDEYKSKRGSGNGYCCYVVYSKTQSEKVRRPEMSRCELYEAGDFKTRHETKGK